jgi:hypothetical protein
MNSNSDVIIKGSIVNDTIGLGKDGKPRAIRFSSASNGAAYAIFTVCVSKYAGKDDEGKAKYSSKYIACQCFDAIANNLAYLNKIGLMKHKTRICVFGEINVYKGQDGNWKQTVLATDIYLNPAKAKAHEEAAESYEATVADNDLTPEEQAIADAIAQDE